MENLTNYSQQEKDLIKTINDNSIWNVKGFLLFNSVFIIIMVSMSISLISSKININIPYGIELFKIFFIISAIISFRQSLIQPILENKLIKLISDRIQLKIVNKNNLLSERNKPQLYDEQSKTYYHVLFIYNKTKQELEVKILQQKELIP